MPIAPAEDALAGLHQRRSVSPKRWDTQGSHMNKFPISFVRVIHAPHKV